MWKFFGLMRCVVGESGVLENSKWCCVSGWCGMCSVVVLLRMEWVCEGVELLGWWVSGGALWPRGLVRLLVHLVVWCRLCSGFACSVQFGLRTMADTFDGCAFSIAW